MILALVILLSPICSCWHCPKSARGWPCAVRRCSWHWDSWACMIFALGGAGGGGLQCAADDVWHHGDRIAVHPEPDAGPPGRAADRPGAQCPVGCVRAGTFAGVISAFVDNVATVLMVAPVGLAIARKLKISPVPVIIAIAVSSNLQGAATLVGDTTSILLGGFAEMNFFDFFWMHGRPGVFWGVELGALTSLLVLLWLFRKEKQPITARVETQVEDDVPTALMLLTVGLLIVASFLPQPESGLLATLYELRSGLICMTLCVVGVVRACLRDRSAKPLVQVVQELDRDTLLLLFGLFIVIAGIRTAGVIDAAAQLFHTVAGEDPFRLYVLLVVVSVVLSAFIDNIPYVATMLPVVQGIAALMNNGAGMAPEVFYFGLLTGATLGGNLTPIGASANIAAIGILRKNGETVRTADFCASGCPLHWRQC